MSEICALLAQGLAGSLSASVLICTRNRAAYLCDTIRAAAAQTLSTGRFEIVVVDNGSTDSTSAVVRNCQSAITGISLRYVVETEVGLSAARNRAIREANGRILCFLDDDAMPESEWLEWLVRGYAGGAQVMCVGGAIVPVYDAPLPIWFHKDLEFIFKPQLQGAELHQVAFPRYPYGANFSIRAEAVEHLGDFNRSLGYKGTNLIPCEETEFLLRAEKAGFDILMEPRSVVRHIIPSNRLSRRYLLRRQYAYGQGVALMEFLHSTKAERKNRTPIGIRKLGALWATAIGSRFRSWRCRVRDHQTTRALLFLELTRVAQRLGYAEQEWRNSVRSMLWKAKQVFLL